MTDSTRLRALLLAACIGLPGTAGAAELALTRVMLSSGGVGYVEYAGAPDGGPLGLDVPLDQVDDVLKSLVVFDAAGGVGGFSLPGKDNAREAFGDVPIGPQALTSPVEFLNGLRGVAIEVKGPAAMAGLLMRAERVPEPAGREGAVERTRVTLMTDAGLRQFVLEEVESVQVADPALRAKIGRALEALRRDSAQTVRHITLAPPRLAGGGAGTKSLRVGYVVGAPLWKVSYRVVLPAQGAAAPTARLQGWAVLENATGADWKGVEVALQYGNPVTFRQALYATYFVQRPEVPVEVLGRILPGVDTRARPMAQNFAAAPPPPAPAGAARAEMAAKSAPILAAPAPAPVMAAPAEAAAASEGAQETVFVLPGKVSLAAGHTASVPILDREVKAARIGLLQPGRTHPLASIRLTNDTPTSLPAGVLTLYDPASPAMFAGDARLGGLPAGESRLLSFAEDLRTTAEWSAEEAGSIAAVTASAGVLRVDERLRYTSRAVLTGPAAEPRDLLVEIARRPGATLVADGPKPAEETASAWRFAVSLKPGEVARLAVQQERITRRQVALINDDGTLLRLLGTPEVAAPVKAALQRLADLRAAGAARQAEVERLEAQYAGIERDQERIRKNIAAVPANDALRGRLVRQLEALENRVDGLNQQTDQAKAAVEQAQKALEEAIAKFTL